MPIRNRIAELQPELAALRRDIHAHPELGAETKRTSALVAEELRAMGCDQVVEGIGGLGVVGLIRGRADSAGRVLGLRGDMDALPIAEETGAEHASRTPGVMHACGHDGHTAMLLGAARYLAETRNFDGAVALIFQPAEETGQGARAMIEDGLMARFAIQEVYGLHNMPGLPVGAFALRPGPLMAAVDEFDITVTGRGGHAAKPHETVDPTVIAAQIVVAAQSIISRNADPVAEGVLSVTSVRTSATAYNVIPQSVHLRGTVRSHDAALQDRVEARLGALAQGIAAAMGGRAEMVYDRIVPITVNAAAPTALAREAAQAVAGQAPGQLREAPLIMGGEDFAFMLNARPGAFVFVGNGDNAPLHHPEYDFNDAAIAAGASFFAELVERRMPAG